MKQMRAPSFRKNSYLKDFAVALSSSEERKFCDFSGTRVVGEEVLPKLKFLPNLLKAKAFCTAAKSPIGFRPDTYHDHI